MATPAPAAMNKSLSIVGMGHSLTDYLQDFERHYKKPTSETWGINSVGVWLRPIDKIIALDNFRRDLTMEGGKHVQYVRNILDSGIPIISDVADPEWPQVEAYPLERVVRNIWPSARRDDHCRPGLANTINYALALAIADGFTEIRLYGCDFRRSDDKYLIYALADAHHDKPYWWPFHCRELVDHRRDLEPGEPQTMFLLGVAHQRGISIAIPPTSSLCDMDRAFYFYGYDRDQPKVFKDEEDGAANAA